MSDATQLLGEIRRIANAGVVSGGNNPELRETLDQFDQFIAGHKTEIERLREALERIADIEPDPDNMQRFHDIANDALAGKDRP